MVSDLGAWNMADFAATAREHNGEGSDDDLPRYVRFLRNVFKLLRKRRNNFPNDMRKDGLAIFLLSATPPKTSPHPRVPQLGNGATEVVGRVWFVSEIAQSGRYFEPEFTDDGELFDYVVDTLGCGTIPAITYNPRLSTPEICYYPDGLEDEENCTSMHLIENAVTLDAIMDVIDRVHKTGFITPDAQVDHGSTVWHDNEKYFVIKYAEAVVQSHLKTALAIKFINCNIRHEQRMNAGRVDLEIEHISPENGLSITRPAVIEVKVLRTKGSTGRISSTEAIHRWITRGVKQVAGYRDERHARWGILCCFDMRAEDTGNQCFNHVSKAAEGLQVELKRVFLYNTSEAYRTAIYGPAMNDA